MNWAAISAFLAGAGLAFTITRWWYEHRERLVVEWDFRSAVNMGGWPMVALTVTIRNNHSAAIVVDRLDVSGPPMLNVLSYGEHRRMTKISGDPYFADFVAVRIEPGNQHSLEFEIYPNWQAIVSDWKASHPHVGDSGHLAGMVTYLTAALNLRSNARIFLPNTKRATHKIATDKIAENAAIAAKIGGDRALFIEEPS